MVKGLKSLHNKLTRKIPDAVRRQVRKAMEKSAEEIVAGARRFVPVSPGGGTLRDSIGWTWGDPPGGSLVLAESKAKPGDLKLTVFAGSKAAYYVRFVEFGTVSQTAQPFFFPAYRTVKKRVKSRTTRAMRKAIREGAK